MAKEIKVQRIQKQDQKKKPTVINERRENIAESLSAKSYSDDILKVINAPVRTVIYVEIGDSTPEQIRMLLTQINEAYKNNESGVHYVVPVRNGKLRTDIQFEQEFLETIRSICEVRDGAIEFKDGYSETIVIRENI